VATRNESMPFERIPALIKDLLNQGYGVKCTDFDTSDFVIILSGNKNRIEGTVSAKEVIKFLPS
jgi:hypothetical protein